MGLAHKSSEFVQCAVHRVDTGVIGNVVAFVLQRRGAEGQQPECGDAEISDVVELCRQPAKVADTVAIFINKTTDVYLVDDRVLVPERIVLERETLVARSLAGSWLVVARHISRRVGSDDG